MKKEVPLENKFWKFMSSIGIFPHIVKLRVESSLFRCVAGKGSFDMSYAAIESFPPDV